MKANGKMASCMAKVKNKLFTYDLLILTLFDNSKGKEFWNNGDIYEGEY